KTIGTSAVVGPFIGLRNYTDLLGDREFWASLALTVKFTFLAELFKPTLGVIAALLIHNLRRYRVVISALILLPWIVPAIVQALIWRALFNPVFGGLNYLLVAPGLSTTGWAWRRDPATALVFLRLVHSWPAIPCVR